MSGPRQVDARRSRLTEAAAEDVVGQRRTALASIVAATLLVALKLGTGLVTGNLGLVSAGIESSGDVVAATVTFFAVRLGARPADPEHPYGHRRVENLSIASLRDELSGSGAFGSERPGHARPPELGRWHRACRRPGRGLIARFASRRRWGHVSGHETAITADCAKPLHPMKPGLGSLRVPNLS
jgi:Cation efflux family